MPGPGVAQLAENQTLTKSCTIRGQPRMMRVGILGFGRVPSCGKSPEATKELAKKVRSLATRSGRGDRPSAQPQSHEDRADERPASTRCSTPGFPRGGVKTSPPSSKVTHYPRKSLQTRPLRRSKPCRSRSTSEHASSWSRLGRLGPSRPDVGSTATGRRRNPTNLKQRA